jgi:putative DNA primase/helicase
MNAVTENLLTRLRDFTGHTEQETGPASWQARCPVHHDGKASLSISEGDKCVLLYCHANCETVDIVEQLDLRTSELFYDNGNGRSKLRVPKTTKAKAPTKPKPKAAAKPKAEVKGEIEKVYPYHDAVGTLLYEVVRYKPKGFRQRQPNGNGGWIRNLKGIERVLYKLPELKKAIAAGRTIFVVEGERDADNLCGRGFAATTNAGGAGKWLPQYSDTLRGANCVLLPDNDGPGCAGMQKIAGELYGTAASLRWLELPGLPEKGDVTDFIEAGGTADELKSLVRDAPEWVPSDDAEVKAEGGEGVESEGDAEHGEWDALIPFTSAPPPWPEGVFPPALEAVLDEMAWSIQAPREIIAGGLMAVLATAAQGKIQAQGLSIQHQEEMGLFILSIAEPSERKSPVIRELAKPLNKWESEQAEQLAPAVHEAKAFNALIDNKIESVQRNMKAETSVGDALQTIMALEEQRRAVPTLPRLLVSDFTPERLGVMMAEQSGRIASVDAEGSCFDSISGKYGSGRTDPDLLLRGFSGDPIRVDRLGREPIHIPRACMTLGQSVQPLRLADILSDPIAQGLGFTARFMYLVAEGRSGGRVVEERNTAPTVMQVYGRVVRKLLDVPVPEEPCLLCMSPEAKSIWKAFAQGVENDMAPGGPLSHGLLKSWGGKFPNTMFRVAGLLHIAHHVGELGAFDPLELDKLPPVSGEAMAMAVKAAACFRAHAVTVFDGASADPDTRIAKGILSWARRHRKETFTQRDAHHGIQRKVNNADELKRPLDILRERGYIRPTAPLKTGRRGGRPKSACYEMNPKIKNPESAYNTYKTPDVDANG